MAKFVFEFEGLLRKRRHEEREQMGRVAELERERLALESEIRGIQRTIVDEKRDLAERLSTEKRQARGDGSDHGWSEAPERGVDLRAVRMQANASLRLIDRAQRAVIMLKGVHDRIDKARLELVERTTRRRAIELLREQRHEAWLSAQRAREQAELDELAVLRGSRFTPGAQRATDGSTGRGWDSTEGFER